MMIVNPALPQLRLTELSQITGIPQVTIASDLNLEQEIEEIEEDEECS